MEKEMTNRKPEKKRGRARIRSFAASLLGLLLAAAVMACPVMSAPALADSEGADSGYVTDTNKDVKIESKSGAVYDSAHDVMLYDKNADKKMYPASCTKVLTALVVLENAKDLKKQVTVSQEAIDSLEEGSSHIALVPGEKVTIQDLLYGLILESGNDCANVLAEEIGGSKEGFAEMMNAKAKELGAVDSHFVNPHGMPNKQHYTTAHDLAVIMDACVRNEQFVKIDSALKYKIKKTNKSKSRELWNSHRMILNKYAYYEGVVGGKSGFTKESKCCLITYAKKNGMELIVVVMRNGTPHGCVEDTSALLDFYLKKHEVMKTEASSPAGSAQIEEKDVEYEEAAMPEIIVPNDTDAEALEKKAVIDENVTLPVSKGDRIGEEMISVNGRLLGKADLISTVDVRSNTIFIVIGAIAAALAVFAAAVSVMMRSKNKKKKRRGKRIFS